VNACYICPVIDLALQSGSLAGREKTVLTHRLSPFACAFSLWNIVSQPSLCFLPLSVAQLIFRFPDSDVQKREQPDGPFGSQALPGRQPTVLICCVGKIRLNLTGLGPDG